MRWLLVGSRRERQSRADVPAASRLTPAVGRRDHRGDGRLRAEAACPAVGTRGAVTAVVCEAPACRRCRAARRCRIGALDAGVPTAGSASALATVAAASRACHRNRADVVGDRGQQLERVVVPAGGSCRSDGVLQRDRRCEDQRAAEAAAAATDRGQDFLEPGQASITRGHAAGRRPAGPAAAARRRCRSGSSRCRRGCAVVADRVDLGGLGQPPLSAMVAAR